MQGTDSWRRYYISSTYDFIKISIRSLWKAFFILIMTGKIVLGHKIFISTFL